MAKKKASDSGQGRSKGAKKKQNESVGKRGKPLTPRQTNLIQGIIAGKSTRQAALDAGYSERSADNPKELLSTEALRGFCQQRLSIDKVLKRIDEGMDATQSTPIVIGRKGQETIEMVESPNYFERRSAAALAAKLIGADPAAKIEVKGDLTQFVKVEFVNVAACPEP
jgi:hypothetical protein